MEWILIGALLVAMIVMMVVQGRRQKKAQADYLTMLDTLRPGTKVKMASGLLGRIKEIREEAPGFKVVVLDVGDYKNPVLMTFVMEAVQGIVNEEAINRMNIKKDLEDKVAAAQDAATTDKAVTDDAAVATEQPKKRTTKKRK